MTQGLFVWLTFSFSLTFSLTQSKQIWLFSTHISSNLRPWEVKHLCKLVHSPGHFPLSLLHGSPIKVYHQWGKSRAPVLPSTSECDVWPQPERGLLSCTSDTTQQRAVQSMCLSPPVCFEKPQTSQGKHKWGEEGTRVTRCSTDDQLRPTPQPDQPGSKNAMNEQRVAANSRSVTSSDVWGGPEVFTVVERGNQRAPQGQAEALG